MKVGDLVKYRAHNSHLQHLIGLVAAVHMNNCQQTRAKMLWNDPARNWIWVWISELEIVSESR